MSQNKFQIPIRVSRRAKYLRIVIQPNGAVHVTAPLGMPDLLIRRFVQSKWHWISQKVSTAKRRGLISLPQASRKEYQRLKEKARELVKIKVELFNRLYNFPVGKISIRNQKSRWGSCSRQGNLSFNYRILFLPSHLQDYIVVHELCHIRELNHSKRFWNLVAQTTPDYREHKRELKRYMFTS